MRHVLSTRVEAWGGAAAAEYGAEGGAIGGRGMARTVSSIQRDLTAKRVQRSSSMRHMYTLVKCLQKSAYSIQKVPSLDDLEKCSIWRSREFHAAESSDHLPFHSVASPDSSSGMRNRMSLLSSKSPPVTMQ